MARKKAVQNEALKGTPAGYGALVVHLPARAAPKAFELLAQQPASLIGLTQEQRDNVVVSAVADEGGGDHVLSLFGDEAWDFAPEVKAKNKTAREKRIDWPTDVPKALLNDAKAALYCALRQGRNGMDWSASSATTVGKGGVRTLRYLASLGFENFSQVRSLHIIDYIAKLKKSITAMSSYQLLANLDQVREFHTEMFYPLTEHPFGGKALYEAVGAQQQRGGQVGRVGVTPVIPPSVQKRLWEHCEAVLATATKRFNERDQGLIEAASQRLTVLRDAVLYRLQITSGMRNSESVGLTNGCWRSEERTLRDGRRVTYHWVRTREIKTTGGEERDYLIPGELFASLEVLQRYAEPLQRRLADEARWLEMVIAAVGDADARIPNEMTVVEAVQRLNHVREIGQYLFLTLNRVASDHLGTGARVEVLSAQRSGDALQRLSRAAGVDWELANHQCRRTFAWNVANSRMGRMGLVFLKWQLKHASISWTQLYAANPRQDQALYQEFSDAMRESKVELIASWQAADARLSGVAGKKLMQTRATAVKNFQQLLESTADSVNLRSTGHAWCMSGIQGCHGQGIYDPSLCGGCSRAIIDESQSSRWQMIHLDNLRLAAITDCGPAVEAKAKRSVEMSTQVLVDLGVALPTAEQAKTYAEGAWVG